jgi:hypothetical protein
VFEDFGGCGEGYGEEVDGWCLIPVLKNEDWFMGLFRFSLLVNSARFVEVTIQGC